MKLSFACISTKSDVIVGVLFFIQMETEEIPYDVTMFWEFYRWEQYKMGDIYLQIFPNGKMYAGQTIDFDGRISKYRINQGSNKHHSNAIKYHGWNNVDVLRIACPWYLLDTIEIFLISYYDLMNSDKGYNKTSGGRKFWKFSDELRAQLSASQKASFTKYPGRAAAHSTRTSGKNNPNWGNRGHLAFCYGKTWKKTTEQIAKVSGVNHWTTKIAPEEHPCSGDNHWAKKILPSEHPRRGQKQTPQAIQNKSGIKHGQASPVCVFGIVYPTCRDASNSLRDKYKQRGDFIKSWTSTNKHKLYTFRISKEFYAYVISNELENITREQYEEWLLCKN